MSWSSGSQIFSDIIHTLKQSVPEYETRAEIYNSLIQIFENNDCDTLYECLEEDRAFDDAYFELHPDEDEIDPAEAWDDYIEDDLE